MIVLGAGMAGLLAAAILRSSATSVLEAQSAIPNNHSAVLRFRSEVVAQVLGIEFKAVDAMKTIHPWSNPLADALAYSVKTTGAPTLRSILTADNKLSRRFIAPPDLISQMVRSIHCPIHLSRSVTSEFLLGADRPQKAVLSTIPMPTMMRLLQWPKAEDAASLFRWSDGYNISFTVRGLDAYASLYVPAPYLEENRISITGNRVTIETSHPSMEASLLSHIIDEYENDEAAVLHRIDRALNTIGLTGEGLDGRLSDISVTRQKYSKILPVDESIRREFIMWASKEHSVYSLGRYATWRPGLLLDDLVNDVRVIQRISSSPSSSYPYNK